MREREREYIIFKVAVKKKQKTNLSSLNPIPLREATLILLTLALRALLNSPVGPPRLRSSPVASFIRAPEARGASISTTLVPPPPLDAARSAADTPTGPAPMTARS